KLTERLYIRPTSETGMYDTVKLWIKSEADLPLKLYQTVNVFRHETKQTRPLMRVREIVKFKEAHTFHATKDDAAKQVDEAINVYKQFFDTMLLPYKVLRTPSWDTFPGAEYNYDFMSVIPDGKGIELASVINLGNKFSVAFGIQYQNSENAYSYVYQTCYGISERSLGTIMAIHGDNNGLVLPPVVAPIQAIIVPIYYAGKEEPVNKACIEIKERFEKHGIRTSIDTRQNTAGEKFYEWEAKGVPIRIEVGPKDVENKSAVMVRRDTREKKPVKATDIADEVKSTLEDISANMKERADAYLKERILHFNTIGEVKSEYKERLGLVGLPWCGDEKCGRSIEEKIGIPTIGYDEHKGAKDKCASCGNAGKTEMFFGRTY
ncbi:MAG: aminoacyl--tRNA ligase-related protein, partial [Candidatus Micrarchaeaceae archaeon]